jgi:hypothetical protein
MAADALSSSGTDLDASTLLVGVLGALVNGLLAFPIAMVVAGGAVRLLLPFLVLVGSGAVLLTRDGVSDTARLGCYSTATLVLCLPIVGVSFEHTPTLADQLRVFVRLEVAALLVAAPVAALGYWIGHRGSTTDDV